MISAGGDVAACQRVEVVGGGVEIAAEVAVVVAGKQREIMRAADTVSTGVVVAPQRGGQRGGKEGGEQQEAAIAALWRLNACHALRFGVSGMLSFRF